MKIKKIAIITGFLLSCSSPLWWKHDMFGLPLEPLNGLLVVTLSLIISAMSWGAIIGKMKNRNTASIEGIPGSRKNYTVMWILYPIAFILCTVMWYLGIAAFGAVLGLLNWNN